MHSLSLKRTRAHVDRLGELENTIVRTCRVAEVLADNADGASAAVVGRLREACKDARERCGQIGDAKECLLNFDGFMHAQVGPIRDVLQRPAVVSYLNKVGVRMNQELDACMEKIVRGAHDAIRRVSVAVQDLRDVENQRRDGESVKDCVEDLSRVCAAVEKAIGKGLAASKDDSSAEEVSVVVTEREASSHGYDLTDTLDKDAGCGCDSNTSEEEKPDADESSSAHGYVLVSEDGGGI